MYNQLQCTMTGRQLNLSGAWYTVKSRLEGKHGSIQCKDTADAEWNMQSSQKEILKQSRGLHSEKKNTYLPHMVKPTGRGSRLCFLGNIKTKVMWLSVSNILGDSSRTYIKGLISVLCTFYLNQNNSSEVSILV